MKQTTIFYDNMERYWIRNVLRLSLLSVAVVKSLALGFGFLYQNFLGAHMVSTVNVYYFSFNFLNAF